MKDKQYITCKASIKEIWVNIVNPDLSIDEAISKLESLGTKVIEIDEDNLKLKIEVNNDSINSK